MSNNKKLTDMKKLITLWMLALLPLCLSAQADAKAGEILDKAIANLSDKDGIRVDFVGTENGFLLLKGEKFYLNSNRLQSWYDGKTQWSYMADAGEVNISNPTSEELQGINPYFILKGYRNNYNYSYKGNLMKNGVKGHEIILTSKGANNREIIRMNISNIGHPMSIRIEQNGQAVSDINIISFKDNQKLEDSMFRFNQSLYPGVETIDLR